MHIEFISQGLADVNRLLAEAFARAKALTPDQMNACRWAVLDMPGAAQSPDDLQQELIDRLERTRQVARQRALDPPFGWCMVGAQSAALGRTDWGHHGDTCLSVARDFLRDVAPPPGSVLDVAAGTGRCGLALAMEGHDVSLFDPAAGFLGLAAAKADSQGLTDRVDALLCGTFDDLSALPDDAYDACLCIGSIYYLLSPRYVEQAVTQLARIASKSVVFDVASKLGAILQMGTDDSELEYSPPAVEQILATGITPPATPENGRVVYSCFLAAELRRFVESAGMQLRQLVGIGSVADDLSNILTDLNLQHHPQIDQLLTGSDAAIDRAPRILALCTKGD